MLLGIKFCGNAKEEAKRVTGMDFLARKKNTLKIFTSFIPAHIRKAAAGFLAITDRTKLITDAGIEKIVEDAFDCGIRIGFRVLVKIRKSYFNSLQYKVKMYSVI